MDKKCETCRACVTNNTNVYVVTKIISKSLIKS